MTDGPLIVQSDKTVLLEVDHELAGAARAAIAPFAELERAPEHIHTYRITPLALWNARAAGHDAEQVVDALVSFSRYAVPQPLLVDIVDTMARYGRLQLVKSPVHGLVLVSLDRAVLEEVLRNKKIAPMLGARIDDDTVIVHASERGHIKQMLLKIGWPAEDLAGYVDGEAHPIELEQDGWELRDYQEMAADSFWAGGSGVVVLPCGAGKTHRRRGGDGQGGRDDADPGHQHRRGQAVEARADRPHLADRGGDRRVLRRAQGDSARHHRDLSGDHASHQGRVQHLELFDSRDWGLIIYDEVHLLPAPVFRMTADLQSRRRLGLTATLIREDGREGDVFSLIGPKRYDAPWKDIEAQGWIAPAECIEVRVTMTDNERMIYATAEPEERYKLCSTAHTKIAVVKSILARHPGEPTLVIGAYLDQLDELGRELDAPVIQGSTKTAEREALFDAFRTGEIQTLVVSKVANFSIDLPEASVAVQVSGTFGSRQEEAQRLGRLLRPKADGGGAVFYSVVSRDSLDAEYAAHRQRFLAEQGYGYVIKDADDLLGPGDMTVRRVVPILTVADLDAARAAYVETLGLAEVMNHGWILTLADVTRGHQISLMTRDLTAAVNPDVSVEVDDVDAAHAAAVAAGLRIVHPLTDEEWGVRRFFFDDPSGNVVNVLSHRR